MFSFVCILASEVGESYGVGTPDRVTIFLIPFGLLKAEPMPTWFTKNKKNKNKTKAELESQPFLSPGFAGNGLLLVWTVAGSFIAMAFLRKQYFNHPFLISYIIYGYFEYL